MTETVFIAAAMTGFTVNVLIWARRLVRLLRKDPREVEYPGQDRFFDAVMVISGTYLIARMVFETGFSNPIGVTDQALIFWWWGGYLLSGLVVASTVLAVGSALVASRVLNEKRPSRPR